MVAVLRRIKLCCLTQRVVFTSKAADERVARGLSEDDVIESILNAPVIYKSLRSRSPRRARSGELLHVMVGITHEGIVVYTKGALRREGAEERFYVLVSAKRAIDD